MTDKACLRTVVVTTILGAEYRIPDVDMATFFIPRSSGATSLTIVNASDVVVVFPVRIVDSIKEGEKELWKMD